MRRGLKASLPVSAAEGEPLVTVDTQELYIGTGSGIKKVSDIVVSETQPDTVDNLKLWLIPSSNVMHAYVNGLWEPVVNATNTDFGGF